jgi:hypothetical protein
MIKVLFLIQLMLLSTSSFAQSRAKFGLGVLLGSPTALSAKYFYGGNQAVDAGLAFSSRYTLVFADYLKHFPGIFGKQNEFVSGLIPYVGVGPIIVFDNDDHHDRNHRRHHRDYFGDEDDDFAFGARIPFGVEWIAREIPVGVALEIVPGLVVMPSTGAFLQAGLAVRYYFQ